jgi:hypothetical protein
MAHWKSMMDPKEYLECHELRGADRIVQIERIEGGEVTGKDGKKSKKPKCFFKGIPRPFLLNRTNCKTLTSLTGSPDMDKWIGKWITLYPTTTSLAGEQVDCIRVRPQSPKPPVPETAQAAE